LGRASATSHYRARPPDFYEFPMKRFVSVITFVLVFALAIVAGFVFSPLFVRQLQGQFLFLNPVSGSIPDPLFDGKADDDSYNVTGTEGATCTPTSVSFTEDPVSSGLYAATFNGTSGILSCGGGLDGLALGPRTILAWIKPAGKGENNLGHIVAKQTDGSNRSWQLIVQGGAAACAGGSDCASMNAPANTSNQTRNHDSPAGTFSYPEGDYISIIAVMTCTSTTIESCDASQLYIDGVAVATGHGTNTGTARTADASDGFYIGNRPADDRTFNGPIKRVAVWDVGLTAEQAAVVHSQGPDYVTP
jgi:hypothetical protein